VAPLSEALQEAPGSLGTVRNAVLLLELLAEGPAYQHLTDLADRSGLSLATVHRLLRSLVLAGLVEQDSRSSCYGLGPSLTRLAHRYLARLPVLGALAPYLVLVRDGVGATVRVQVLVGSSVVDVDRVDGLDSDPYRDPYNVQAALCTAGGRLLAARADDERWKQALAEVDEPTRDLAERERDDWATARALTACSPAPGSRLEVAVPVAGAPGAPLGALTVDLPPGATAERVEAAIGQLARAAAAAVRTLGHG
jgi:DNA-binding IclR family transcriptional regulator